MHSTLIIWCPPTCAAVGATLPPSPSGGTLYLKSQKAMSYYCKTNPRPPSTTDVTARHTNTLFYRIGFASLEMFRTIISLQRWLPDPDAALPRARPSSLAGPAGCRRLSYRPARCPRGRRAGGSSGLFGGPSSGCPSSCTS